MPRAASSAPQQLAPDFERLTPPAHDAQLQHMARLLADAIAARKKLLIVADYDADGATACAVGLRALRAVRRQMSTIWCPTASNTATA